MTLEIPILAWHRHKICGGVKAVNGFPTAIHIQTTYKEKEKHAQIASTQKDHMEGLLRKNEKKLALTFIDDVLALIPSLVTILISSVLSNLK